jgi:hypothetical protein
MTIYTRATQTLAGSASLLLTGLARSPPSQADIFSDRRLDLIATTVQPAPVAPNSWRGILRSNCDFSHAAYADPLVFPGQPDHAHYHNFYGFFDTDATTRAEDLYASAASGQRVSSRQGNQLNRGAYRAGGRAIGRLALHPGAECTSELLIFGAT